MDVSEAKPTTIGDLAGVGERSEPLFRALDIATPRDLLDDFPFRYEDLREPMLAANLVERTDAEVNALGEVETVRERRARSGIEIVEVRLRDSSGTFLAKWIGRRRYVYGRFREGQRIFVRGRLERTLAQPTINVSHYRILASGEVYRGELVPVYRASRDLASRKIAAVVKKNLRALLDECGADVLPAALSRERGFPSLRDAYRAVHAPATPREAELARTRFAFAEFLVVAAGTLLRRADRQERHDAAAISAPRELLAQLEASLPFALTDAQRRSIAEIWADMGRDVPMNRLLQGDVGSGKTLVAAAAVILAARSGVQSALMAPTEILAAQHVEKLGPLLAPFGVAVEPVYASQGQRSRNAAVAKLASGEAALAVGTHALLTQGVEFRSLGLVVIDEQHRFGVEHRARLRAKGVSPHTLHMTATPIPRTLAQTLYADFDESRLDELPPGRTPVRTFAIRDSRLPQAYEFVRAAVERGGQAYVVAPAIDEAQTGATSAVAEYERLGGRVFANLRLGIVHGRLAPRERDATMERFVRGDIDVLVATTVIEVGVDVPNASVIVVLDAQRFGLAQLHQLRGRVGRGAAESVCILAYPGDTQELARLEILTQTNDGFAIAEKDLAMRGAGEFAGTMQSGKDGFRFGDIAEDFALYKQARDEAAALLRSDPKLRAAEHAALRAALDATPSLHSLLASS
ncbi:MAG: ATP-dependent DNA helicase RecG [Candidatus Tyrphobacter sp.]